MCVANSARSQMAEGLARSMAPPSVQISSAGSAPAFVHPLSIEVLADIGIDIAEYTSKGLESIDTGSIDAVITLCEREVCPTFPGSVCRVHWALPDPGVAALEAGGALEGFRTVRDTLRERLALLFE